MPIEERPNEGTREQGNEQATRRPIRSPYVPIPVFSLPRSLAPSLPCSLAPSLPALVNLPYSRASNFTGSPALSSNERTHVHLHPASHVGIHQGCAAPRSLQIVFFRSPGAIRAVRSQPGSDHRDPATCPCHSLAPLGAKVGIALYRRRMMVLSSTRTMDAILFSPVPVFLTRTATLLPFVGLSQERVQDQPL